MAFEKCTGTSWHLKGQYSSLIMHSLEQLLLHMLCVDVVVFSNVIGNEETIKGSERICYNSIKTGSSFMT